MKNNPRYIAVAAVLFYELYNIIRGFDYYKRLFTKLDSIFRYNGVFDTIQEIYYLLFLLLNFTLITLFFTSTGQYQDKVYKLLRYIFLMSIFLHIPYTLYLYASGRFFGLDLHIVVFQTIGVAISIACSVLLLRAKPQSQPAPIDLAEYELVTYTTMGHRFVHYLLDILFVLPVFWFWGRVLPYYMTENVYLLQALFTMLYLVYCFLSELIFRQTLGKIATNSCVTTIGQQFTIGQILLRTLARLIPFDRFSFLFGANWHDKTTSTSVVYVDTWEKAFDDSDPSNVLATRK